MDQKPQILTVETTIEEVESFFQNEVFAKRIQELKNTEAYKKLPKLKDSTEIKMLKVIARKRVKAILEETSAKFEGILFGNLCLQAYAIACSNFITNKGKNDMIKEIEDAMTTELLIAVNQLCIRGFESSISAEVKNSFEKEFIYNNNLFVGENL